MSHQYLLEVGVEEMPAHVVTPSIHQLKQRVSKFLDDERLTYGEIKEYSTPRRLALLISDLADKQPDIDESVKGPAKKIAQDADGNWTKAAIGFSRGQGASVDDIEFKSIKGVEYVFVEKHIPGQAAEEVLKSLPKVIESMNFPTMMRWGNHNLQFIRPIRWLVSLLDQEVVPFKILDVEAGRTSRGHRFLGHEFEIQTANDYEQDLHEEFVIADAQQRKALIQKQIQEIVDEHGWTLDEDLNLLEEVNNLVEWPTAFAGSFDPKYLDLPEEVLITSMRDNQRFFCVRGNDGKLLPNFISVRNGNSEYLDNVIKGNERVLVPRLEDAKFFYEEDQKLSIDQYVERLKKVSFHDQISSMYDKMARTAVIANMLGEKLGLSADQLADLNRAAHIYKFDLTSQMVGEFAELQGTMGEIYARLFGEKADVAQAIGEQYMPISAEGNLPASQLGTILSMADKLDSIYSFFAVGMIPSGSNDPYALRRQAYGIVRMIAANKWHLPILAMQADVKQALDQAGISVNFDYVKNSQQVTEFFLDRIKQFFSADHLRHDIVDAVSDSQQADIADILAAGKVLDAHKDDDSFKDDIEALTRVARIAKKADANTPDTVDSSLFQNPSEKALAEQVQQIEQDFSAHDLEADLQALRSLQANITAYFDENMVMDKDTAVRNNRLAQMKQIAQLMSVFGNLDKLIVK